MRRFRTIWSKKVGTTPCMHCDFGGIRRVPLLLLLLLLSAHQLRLLIFL
jgi:hypothetical protein